MKKLVIIATILVLALLFFVPFPYYDTLCPKFPSIGEETEVSCPAWVLADPLWKQLVNISRSYFNQSQGGSAKTTTPGITIKNNIVYQPVSIRIILNQPESYLNRNVKITGKLTSEGNIFVDGRFYLVDGLNKIIVKPWLVLEVVQPPNDKNGKGAYPRTMSSIIGRFLDLKGQIKRSGSELYFEVQDFKEVVMPPD